MLPADAGVPKGEANALALRDDPDHPVQTGPYGIQVMLKWESSRRLSVLFPRGAVADKRATNVREVSIEYGTF